MDSWVGVGLVILFVIFQVLRAAVRGGKNANSGMARLNAAAERILKERRNTGNAPKAAPNATTNAHPNSGPRTQSLSTKATRSPSAASKPRPSGALLPKSTTPAVMRRDGLLSSGKEPVIQRRR